MIVILLLNFLFVAGAILIALNHKKQNLQIQMEQVKKQQELLKKERQQLEVMHWIQHDVQNHFLVIDQLIQRGENEKAVLYIENYLTVLQEDFPAQKADFLLQKS